MLGAYLKFVSIKSSSGSFIFSSVEILSFFYLHGLTALLCLLILLLNYTDTDLKHPKRLSVSTFWGPLAQLEGREKMHRLRQSRFTACIAGRHVQKEYMKVNKAKY